MTIAELLIAAVIAAGLIATLFGIADPLQGLFEGHLELVEMHQRLRTGVHAIERDVMAAGPPIMPYRAGARRSDPSIGIYYRDDTISLVSAPWPDRAVVPGLHAAPLAALMQEREQMRGKRVGLILSGGNIDREVYAEVLAGRTPR